MSLPSTRSNPQNKLRPMWLKISPNFEQQTVGLFELHAKEPIVEKNPRLPLFHRCGFSGATAKFESYANSGTCYLQLEIVCMIWFRSRVISIFCLELVSVQWPIALDAPMRFSRICRAATCTSLHCLCLSWCCLVETTIRAMGLWWILSTFIAKWHVSSSGWTKVIFIEHDLQWIKSGTSNATTKTGTRENTLNLRNCEVTKFGDH